MRTTLASGAWIEHVPIQELKRRHKMLLAGVIKSRLGARLAIDPAAVADGQFDIPALLSSVMQHMNLAEFGAVQQDALLALLITGWSYEMPVPDLKTDGSIENAASLGEIPLADDEEIEALFEPYQEKLSRRPDPKGTTTSSSNGLSRASAVPGSPKG